MVERGAGPVRCGVAGSAILRESDRGVIGTGGFLIIGQMASNALRGPVDVVAVEVALRARHGQVRPGQLEAAEVVVEGGILPRRGGVAAIAGGREFGREVIRVGGRIVIGHVTAGALRRQDLGETTGMALRTVERRVSAGQSERRELGVIEFRAAPDVHAVATLAGSRDLGGDVIERRGGLVVGEMAGDALRAQSGIYTGSRAVMAIVAGRERVRANQRKAIVVLLNG